MRQENVTGAGTQEEGKVQTRPATEMQTRRANTPRAKGTEKRHETAQGGEVNPPGVLGMLDIVATGGTEDLMSRARGRFYEAIDDFVRWRLRMCYFSVLIANSSAKHAGNRALRKFYQKRWLALNARPSPKGQSLVGVAGSIHNDRQAIRLAVLFTQTTVNVYGRTDPALAPPRDCLFALHDAYERMERITGGEVGIAVQVVCEAINQIHVTTQSRINGTPFADRLHTAACTNILCPARHLTYLYRPGHDHLTKCPSCGSCLKIAI